MYWSDTVGAAVLEEKEKFSSFFQGAVEVRIIRDTKHAAQWVEASQKLFSARVDLPNFLSMGKEEQAEAAKQYARLWDEDIEEDEKEEILEPFKFRFNLTDDLWKFCEEIIDTEICWPTVNVTDEEKFIL